MLDDLADYEASVHSQCGEDGVLERLFDVIGVRERYFVEFGAWDGQHLSNTANLRLHKDWRGLLMEGSDRADGELVQWEFVRSDNVNELFARHGVPAVFDLLSIDIDGNDYWIWKAIDSFTARVVVVEYNVFFGLHQSCTMPYDPDWVWDRSYYHGASIAAFQKLGREKGYTLVYADRFAPNAFFVLDSELPAGFRERPLADITPWNTFEHSAPVGDREWQYV